MARVFISYSHRDLDFYQAFQIHLKPWVAQGSLDVWSDQALAPSEKWHEEIQQALRETEVAVLLVSPDFLASTYICQHELPHLISAREAGHISLTCLYLRDSGVAEFEIASVKLTDYQGLNSPQDFIAKHETHQRDTLYKEAAIQLRALVEGPRPGARQMRPPAGERYDLTVKLTRRGPNLTREYLTPYGRMDEDRTPWHWDDHANPGPTLYHTLFSSQDKSDDILKALFKQDPARPMRHPVRLRLYTDEPAIANLPWSQTAWDTHVLRDHGWTFEFIAGSALSATPDFPDVDLHTPCSVLMIASPQAPHVDVHYRALEEQLFQAWPLYHDKPHWARTWAEVEQTWQQRRPRIVYYYGPVEGDGQTLRLCLDGDEQRDIAAFAQLCKTHAPTVFFCNIVETPAGPGTAMAQLSLPLVITQHSDDAAAARRTALAWFHALLQEGEDMDPIWALQQHGLSTATAWGAYRRWHTRMAPAPDKNRLVQLLLDRKVQRALAATAISELIRDDRQRLYCALVYGAEGNLVTRFADQLYEHLRRHTREAAQVHRVPMRLPDTESFDLGRLAFETRRFWGLQDRESFETALVKRRPRGPGRTRPVLLLDWGARGTDASNRMTVDALEAWIAFCQQSLAPQCPGDLRLVSCLGLEMASARQAILERKVHDDWRPRYRDRAFRLELLPPLDRIDANDLADFLGTTGNSSCPDDLLRDIPALIVRHTQGHFYDTVAMVERAERNGWYTLYDDLTAASAQPPAAPIDRGTLL